jgi:hypothetical protein
MKFLILQIIDYQLFMYIKFHWTLNFKHLSKAKTVKKRFGRKKRHFIA